MEPCGTMQARSDYLAFTPGQVDSHWSVTTCMRACVRACVCVCACRCVFPDILDLTPRLPTLCMTMHALVWPQPSVSPFLVILCFVQCAMFECLTPDSCPAIGYLYTLNNTTCDQIWENRPLYNTFVLYGPKALHAKAQSKDFALSTPHGMAS